MEYSWAEALLSLRKSTGLRSMTLIAAGSALLRHNENNPDIALNRYSLTYRIDYLAQSSPVRYILRVDLDFNASSSLEYPLDSKFYSTMLDDGPGLYLAMSTLVVAVLSYCRKYSLNHSHPPLPPSPTTLPVLGNVLSFLSARPWLTFNAWRSTYGLYIVTGICS